MDRNAPIKVNIADKTATVSLNRPEKRNAFTAEMIHRISEVFTSLLPSLDCRAVVLTGVGEHFCAGADLEWMRDSARGGEAANAKEAAALAAMLRLIQQCPLPTIAVVRGMALGGGAGLVAACDIALADEGATFAFSEVRLGLIPATIGPYVVAAIGPRMARRLFVTGQPVTAAEALQLHLIHEMYRGDALDAALDRVLGAIRKNGPQAMAEAKRLVNVLTDTRPVAETDRMTASWIARIRASAEGQEGISAFLERRPPAWMESGKDDKR